MSGCKRRRLCAEEINELMNEDDFDNPFDDSDSGSSGSSSESEGEELSGSDEEIVLPSDWTEKGK